MIAFKKITLTFIALFLIGLINSIAQDEQWYIPIDVSASFTPMIFVNPGAQGPGYAVAGNQACAQELANENPFCTTADWDNLCQEQYNDCVYTPGCSGLLGDWYIPNTLGSAPIIYACEPPSGYFLADQVCAQQIATVDPFCTNSNWDAICSSAYNCCLGIEGCGDSDACNFNPALCVNNDLCEYPQIYIPIVLGSGPLIIDCTRPTDYILAEQECAQDRLDNDSFCSASNWDLICQSTYECCQNSGCTDTNACNYDANACIPDNDTCIFGGCTYPDALNYDSMAVCDNGSCTYPIEGDQCLGDLNGDYSVTISDLSIFLSVFSSNCPNPNDD